MLETIVGIVVGGLVGWLTTHAYYLKQEKSSPIPLIKEIGSHVQNLANLQPLRDQINQLYELAVVRNDMELQNQVQALIRKSLESYLEILHSFLPYDLMIQSLCAAYALDKTCLDKKASETVPKLCDFRDNLTAARDEMFRLLEMTEKLGKPSSKTLAENLPKNACV